MSNLILITNGKAWTANASTRRKLHIHATAWAKRVDPSAKQMHATDLQHLCWAVHCHRNGLWRHIHQETRGDGPQYSSVTAHHNVHTSVFLLDLPLVSHVLNCNTLLALKRASTMRLRSGNCSYAHWSIRRPLCSVSGILTLTVCSSDRFLPDHSDFCHDNWGLLHPIRGDSVAHCS